MPNAASFVHLHVHTQYSLLDGAIRIDRLLQKAQAFNMPSVAITDHGTMFGVIDFYNQATKAGIKPIIGCECYLAPRRLTDKTPLDSKGINHLILLARDQDGYNNLCKLATVAQLQGFYYKPRIDKEALRAHSQGLIAMSACLHGEIPRRITENRLEDAENAAREYQSIFGEDNFFLEVQNNGIDDQERVNAALKDMSSRLGIPLVASNDCHYLEKEDVRAHGVLLCIQTGKTIHDANRFKFETDQLYFKSPHEMQQYFKDYPGSIENTFKIADRCHVEFDFNTYHFPKYESDDRLDVDDLFQKKVNEGFEERFEQLKQRNPDLHRPIYEERLEYEIGVIKSMGFAGYFLIVSDFIRYAKKNGIPVGPGRGSAAGSLIAFALNITDLDPLEHGLIFERFLNPSRISMPDIDVDFCINGREKVFKYVTDRYGGGDFVAQIITFGKLKPRAVIRDVGRALDIPLKDVDTIAKLVPDVLNIGLNDAIKQEARLQKMIKTRPEVDDLFKICRVLEGLPRHASTHAAGVVIGDKPLVEYLPLYRGKKGEVVTQFDMKKVEQIGLVKFDFLGLRNLTVIENTLKLIRRQGKQAPDLMTLDLEDAPTYQLLSSGDTTGVFQLESSGMKDLLVRMKPASFADVVALVALYRPGPLNSGMVDEFVERKHGRKKVTFLVPELEPILRETYGVIVYQEQVMKIAGELADYSMAEADGLRKAMGKKITQIMAEHRDRFVKGAVQNNIPKEKAEEIFNQMETFGEYGFNKSHSAAYALIAYQTAFLKAHFAVEFMAALLTSEMSHSEHVVKYIDECRRHDITVLPPSINNSEKEFTVAHGNIHFGLVAVKNVGESAIDVIVQARLEGGAYRSIFDFCERVELKKVNKRVIESLIKCGAFDNTQGKRAQLMAVLEDALEYGQRLQREKADPQMGLFGGATADSAVSVNQPALPDIGDWNESEQLRNEKDALGFYMSGHPLKQYEKVLEKYANCSVLQLSESNTVQTVRMGGLIKNVKVVHSKSGPMAFVALEDMGGVIEITVFSRLYTQIRDLLVENRAVMVQGDVQKDENSVKLIADTIIPIEQVEEKWTATVHFRIKTDDTDKTQLQSLYRIIKQHQGACQAFLHLSGRTDALETETVIELPEDLAVQPGMQLDQAVHRLLGYNAIETACKPITAKSATPHNTYRRGNTRRG